MKNSALNSKSKKQVKFKLLCAFTILELIFVVIILGILATIALPKLSASKDEAEISKALNNLKILVNDLSIYALKNDSLSKLKEMTNVPLANTDLSAISSQIEVPFGVGEDNECLKLIFIEKNSATILGISSSEASKQAIISAANSKDDSAFENVDFSKNSSSKACANLSKNEDFKNFASKIYILLGSR